MQTFISFLQTYFNTISPYYPWTAILGALMYLWLLNRLRGHISLSPTGDKNAKCIDGRCTSFYRVPGGVGSFTFGLVMYGTARFIAYPPLSFFMFGVASVQAVLSLLDWAVLMSQFAGKAWHRYNPSAKLGWRYHFGLETVFVYSHLERCGRISAGDPLGLILFLRGGDGKLATDIRDGLTIAYTIVGWIPFLITVSLPSLLLGKIVIPSPFPVPVDTSDHR